MASEAQFQAAILVELNCPTDTVALANIATWWDMNAERDRLYLQYLYTKKHVLGYLLGTTRKFVDITTGFDQIKHQQKFENLLDMMKDLNTQIKQEDPSVAAAADGVVIGYLNSASPVSSLPDTIQDSIDGFTDYYYRSYWITK